jgi:glycosyltransferase involved in cell wall biosynthesis
MTLAWLAPEIPSVSATFVYREILAMEEQGREVLPFSLRPVHHQAVAQEGSRLTRRTRIVYRELPRMALAALREAISHPLLAARLTGLVARDITRGEFRSARQRLALPFQALAGLALADELRQLGATHLHVHFASAPATVGMYAARSVGVPFSVTAHAHDLYVSDSLLREKIERAAFFGTISECNRRHLRARLGPVADRIRIVRCGVRAGAAAGDLRRDNRAPLVLTTARLVPKKGIDTLVRASASLLARRPSLRIEILGDGPERASLEALAAELGLGPRLRFAGACSADVVQERLREASVFALPCRRGPDGDRDGIPVVLMEAMASGVPVVTTTLGGIDELVESGRTGLLVDPDCPDLLAHAIESLLNDPALAVRLAEGGMRAVARDFDLATNAATLAGWIDATAPGAVATSRIETQGLGELRNPETHLTRRGPASRRATPSSRHADCR